MDTLNRTSKQGRGEGCSWFLAQYFMPPRIATNLKLTNCFFFFWGGGDIYHLINQVKQWKAEKSLGAEMGMINIHFHKVLRFCLV